jgi:hypothetical protein
MSLKAFADSRAGKGDSFPFDQVAAYTVANKATLAAKAATALAMKSGLPEDHARASKLHQQASHMTQRAAERPDTPSAYSDVWRARSADHADHSGRHMTAGNRCPAGKFKVAGDPHVPPEDKTS